MPALSELIKDLKLRVINFEDFDVKGIAYHSRQSKDDYIFVAIRGYRTDGREYINDALNRGAKALVVEEPIDLPAIQIITDDARKALAQLATQFYKDVMNKIFLIGITGTNGKTTTAYLIRAILKRAGLGCGLIGSVEYDVGSGVEKSRHTTPEIITILEMLEQMAKNELTHAVVEATSHGLKLKRLYGLNFPVRIFTNLSRDHLDFHGDIDDYQRTKLSFFQGVDKKTLAIINGDDPFSSEIAKNTRARILTYGVDHGMIQARKIDTSDSGLSFQIVKDGIEYPVNMHLLGNHNVYNGLAAFITATELGISPDTVSQGISDLFSVPGRLMPVQNDQGLKIYVDFAHTPDALYHTLKAVGEFTQGRIIVVFGCGGDRDQGKRPEMGKIATELADLTIITSDNPRSEDPLKIIDDIQTGIEKDNFIVEPDRRKAIALGLKKIGPNEALIIAGKGHEEYQLIRDQRIPFADAKVVKELLGCLN